MKFKCIFVSLLKVFIASMTLIYGNFAAPAKNDEVMQEEEWSIDDSLLPPKALEIESLKANDQLPSGEFDDIFNGLDIPINSTEIYEGEGVRDRNEKEPQQPENSGEGVRDRNDRNKSEISSLLRLDIPHESGKDAKILFYEYKHLDNGNYHFE